MISLLLIFLLIPKSALSEIIYLYRIDPTEPRLWSIFTSTIKRENVDIKVYRFRPSIEEHLKLISDVNKKDKGLFVAIRLSQGEKSQVFVAVFNQKQVSGRFLRIDEIPSLHFERSFCVARKVSEVFGIKVQKLPLFPLLGVDMPGIFIFAKGSKDDIAYLARVIIRAKRECE